MTRAAAFAVVALGAAAACKHAPPPPPDDTATIAAILAKHPVDPGLDRDSLTSDLAMYLQVRRDIEPIALAAARHQGVDCGPKRERGPCAGLRRLDEAPGGATSCEEGVFVHGSDLIEARVRCKGFGERWPLVAPFVRDAMGGMGELDASGVRYTFRDDALRARVIDDQARADGLGPAAPVVVPPELADAYDALTSGFVGLDLGEACGYAATPGRGHAQTEAIVKAGRFDILRSVARDLYPAGRVFAALALYRSARPWTPGDTALIQRVRASAGKVPRCAGCDIGFGDASEIIPDPGRQCGRWTDEASAGARGGSEGGPPASAWFTVPSSHLVCDMNSDCVKVGGMCFTSVLDVSAAARPEYAHLPRGNPASGACPPDKRVPRCESGCCVLSER